MKPTIILLPLLIGSAQAATVIGLTADNANSSTSAFGGSVEKTLDDSFAYDPAAPTSVLPTQLYIGPGNAGFHGNVGEGLDIFISYSTPSLTTISAESVVVIDLYGRANNATTNDRDDNIDVQLFNGASLTPVASVTGLSVDNAASDSWVRATFDSLPVGTTFDRILVTGRDSGGGTSNNYFTLMEIRAATIAAVPEPSATGLLALCVGAFLLRRKR